MGAERCRFWHTIVFASTRIKKNFVFRREMASCWNSLELDRDAVIPVVLNLAILYSNPTNPREPWGFSPQRCSRRKFGALGHEHYQSAYLNPSPGNKRRHDPRK